MTIRVAVLGAAGRMGSTVCRAVDDDEDLELVAAVAPSHAGLDLHSVVREVSGAAAPTDLVVSRSLDELDGVELDVVVDFTRVDAARENLRWCAGHGIDAVVGTSGFGPADLDELARSFTDATCVVAPNFAIGAVLMMRFAEMAAPFFDSAEVIELHHDAKVDAPSGTAMMTLERMAAASDQWLPDPTTHEVVPGARGGRGPAGLAVHSVRMRGLVAHQEVLLGTAGQSLSIRHDSYDRSSFMPGVLLAVKAVGAREPGLVLGLDTLLGL